LLNNSCFPECLKKFLKITGRSGDSIPLARQANVGLDPASGRLIPSRFGGYYSESESIALIKAEIAAQLKMAA